jgi:peptidoglycan/LPS O-acetylase OafA/YrhL
MNPARDHAREIPYRADIDGLRAIAVLGVVAFHAAPQSVTGGYTGVDVFFVISGFLICGLIFNGLRDKTFSFADFYARRIRRLFPALTVVLAATWALAWFILSPTEYAALGRHILASAGFVANILTYFDVGYFDAPAETKPLLHLWSLGVEEQFYFIFPALLLLLYCLRSIRLHLLWIGAASFILNVALIRQHQSFVFYLPMTRLWEFIAGALLAHAEFVRGGSNEASSATLFGIPRRNVIAGLGGTLLLLGIVLPKGVNFPGWWAIAPVLGTYLLIGAGPQAHFNRVVLANPKLVLVGLISYPLYLWHWPLLVLARTMMQDSGGDEYVHATTTIVLVLSVALAWLTYRYVERPVRERRLPLKRLQLIGVLAGCLGTVAILGFATSRLDGFPLRYPLEVRALLTPLTLGEDYPPFDVPKVGGFDRVPGQTMVAVWGDSHAGHLLPGLARLQKERPFQFAPVGGLRPCSPMNDIKPEDEASCRQEVADNRALIAQLKPDIVIMGGFWVQYPHLDKITEHFRFFHELGVKRIVVIGTVPGWRQPPQKLLLRAFQADPQHRIPDRLPNSNIGVREDQQLEEIAAASGARFVAAYAVLCNVEGCLERLGPTHKDIIQVDLTHFSAAGSWYFISHIADRIFD